MNLRFKDEEENGLQSHGRQDDSGVGEWDLQIEEPYQTVETGNHPDASAVQVKEKQKKLAASAVRTIIVLLIIGAIVMFAGKTIVSVLMPEGEDITPLLKTDANTIAGKLGVTFTDNPEWVTRIHQYSDGTVTVKAAEDIGIVYIDGKQAGVHIESKDYTMFGVQLGDGEKHAYDTMSYPFDSFFSFLIKDSRNAQTYAPDVFKASYVCAFLNSSYYLFS